MRQLILIAHNLRSAHNVGSLLRTADGLGVAEVWLTGYTPYPVIANDSRLPYLAQSISKRIAKTALGAEKNVVVKQSGNILSVIEGLKKQDFLVTALEQTKSSINITDFKPPQKLALIVGREVEGIEAGVLKMADEVLEIPMLGQKESFNVAVAASMALYSLRFAD
jgi:23S rRNA (guanosine2251-2'-O)-methyltransferase